MMMNPTQPVKSVFQQQMEDAEKSKARPVVQHAPTPTGVPSHAEAQYAMNRARMVENATAQTNLWHQQQQQHHQKQQQQQPLPLPQHHQQQQQPPPQQHQQQQPLPLPHHHQLQQQQPQPSQQHVATAAPVARKMATHLPPSHVAQLNGTVAKPQIPRAPRRPTMHEDTDDDECTMISDSSYSDSDSGDSSADDAYAGSDAEDQPKSVTTNQATQPMVPSKRMDEATLTNMMNRQIQEASVRTTTKRTTNPPSSSSTPRHRHRNTEPSSHQQTTTAGRTVSKQQASKKKHHSSTHDQQLAKLVRRLETLEDKVAEQEDQLRRVTKHCQREKFLGQVISNNGALCKKSLSDRNGFTIPNGEWLWLSNLYHKGNNAVWIACHYIDRQHEVQTVWVRAKENKNHLIGNFTLAPLVLDHSYFDKYIKDKSTTTATKRK